MWTIVVFVLMVMVMVLGAPTIYAMGMLYTESKIQRQLNAVGFYITHKYTVIEGRVEDVLTYNPDHLVPPAPLKSVIGEQMGNLPPCMK